MATRGSPTPEDGGQDPPEFSDSQLRAIAAVVRGVLAEQASEGGRKGEESPAGTNISGAAPNTGEWRLRNIGAGTRESACANGAQGVKGGEAVAQVSPLTNPPHRAGQRTTKRGHQKARPANDRGRGEGRWVDEREQPLCTTHSMADVPLLSDRPK